jgi:hypothetical protein
MTSHDLLLNRGSGLAAGTTPQDFDKEWWERMVVEFAGMGLEPTPSISSAETLFGQLEDPGEIDVDPPSDVGEAGRGSTPWHAAVRAISARSTGGESEQPAGERDRSPFDGLTSLGGHPNTPMDPVERFRFLEENLGPDDYIPAMFAGPRGRLSQLGEGTTGGGGINWGQGTGVVSPMIADVAIAVIDPGKQPGCSMRR